MRNKIKEKQNKGIKLYSMHFYHESYDYHLPVSKKIVQSEKL